MLLFFPRIDQQMRTNVDLELPDDTHYPDIPRVLPAGSIIRIKLEYKHDPLVRVYFDEIPGVVTPKQGRIEHPSWSYWQRMVPLEILQGLDVEFLEDSV